MSYTNLSSKKKTVWGLIAGFDSRCPSIRRRPCQSPGPIFAWPGQQWGFWGSNWKPHGLNGPVDSSHKVSKSMTVFDGFWWLWFVCHCWTVQPLSMCKVVDPVSQQGGVQPREIKVFNDSTDFDHDTRDCFDYHGYYHKNEYYYGIMV